MATLQASKLFDVSGFIALVTGGGSGIGLMIARGLASNGARVYITGRRKEVLEQAAQDISDIKGTLIPIVSDVTDKQSVLALAEEIERREGKLHILVNNAGRAGPFSPFYNDPSAPQWKDTATLGRALFDNESAEDWASIYSVNLMSIFFVSTAFLGLLEKGTKETPGYVSVIINITSISAVMKVCQSHFAYATSKAAASHLTKLLSTELALHKIPIRVNGISPGPWPSEMNGYQGRLLPGEVANKLAGVIPADRGGTEEEMAATALYLASRSGCYAYGHEIIVDGGYLAVNPATV